MNATSPVLIINVARAGTVTEIRSLLASIQAAYDGSLFIDIMSQQPYFPKQISDPSDILYPEEQLRLCSANVSSPGFWSFIGSLNPLETIRQYIADCHQRTLELGREPKILAAMELQNQKLGFELYSDNIDLLRKLGYPDTEIRSMLNKYGILPLAALDEFLQSGLITGTTFRRLGDMKKDASQEPPKQKPPLVPLHPPKKQNASSKDDATNAYKKLREN